MPRPSPCFLEGVCCALPDDCFERVSTFLEFLASAPFAPGFWSGPLFYGLPEGF